jgi:hypothetical protein
MIDYVYISIPERDAILTFHRQAILNESPILSPTLRKTPGLSSVIPVSLEQSREATWLSRGTRKQQYLLDFTGWEIHERVFFQ